MKRWLLGLLIGIIVLPNTVSAQTPAQLQLLQQIFALQVQLQTLQTELAAREQQREIEAPPRVLGADRSIQRSRYYRGEYEAVYLVEGIELYPYRKTIPAEEDTILWQTWVDVVGDATARQYIAEFRLYRDKNATYDAFVEQTADTDDWILGVNLATVSLADLWEREITTELFVHEYAHILHHYHPDVATDFTEAFWQPRSRDKNDYVSDYAMTDSEEDFAESFMYFMLHGSGGLRGEAREKVQFFNQYSDFIAIKAEIYGRLN